MAENRSCEQRIPEEIKGFWEFFVLLGMRTWYERKVSWLITVASVGLMSSAAWGASCDDWPAPPKEAIVEATSTGLQFTATAAADVDLNYEDERQDAFEEAVMDANAKIKKAMKPHGLGDHASLRGIVQLASCYTAGREVRVTVGSTPESRAAAEKTIDLITESMVGESDHGGEQQSHSRLSPEDQFLPMSELTDADHSFKSFTKDQFLPMSELTDADHSVKSFTEDQFLPMSELTDADHSVESFTRGTK